MSNASELFKRVVSRMSFRHPDNTRSLSTPEILENIAKAMEKAEQWEEKRAKLRKDREDADTKYQHALDVIRMQEKQLQRECDHEFHRGTAECDSICRHCGADESDVTPLPQETS